MRQTLEASVPSHAGTQMASAAGGGVDVSHVCALTRAARKPANFHRHVRAAELYERALVAAEALRQPDCLIVAFLRQMRVVSQGKAAFHVISEDRAAMRATASMHLARLEAHLSAVLETLERRHASGTLLPGRCRAHEVAWYADLTRADRSFVAKEMPPDEGRDLRYVSLSAQHVGVDAYFDVARTVVVTLPALLKTRPPDDLVLASCLAYTEHALRLALQRASGEQMRVGLTSTESFFVNVFRSDLLPCERLQLPWCARVLAAWHDLERSGALHRLHGEELRESVRRAEQQLVDAQAAKDERVPLRTCALPSCGAREAHVALFKKCGACAAVVYCSKEHQAEHWPAHKAACKAARKVASQAAAVGKGGASQDA